MGFERNLIIVHTPTKQALSDFTSISALIAERAPEIEVFIATNGHRHSVTRKRAADRPTLVFSPMALREFEPIRGRIYQARRHTKLQEYQRMVAGGVETPVSVLVEPGVVLDPESWGPFTVLKPLVGGQGRGVRLSRTGDVCWVDPESLPPSHPRYGRPLVAQHFVDTGPMARSHRVMLVLGEPVYSLVSAALTARPVLDPDGREPLDLPIASNAGERTLELNFEPDVITFSRRAARCFPEFACLGVDIVREAASGRLFALEVNTSGSVWHISSDYAAPQRTQLDLDLHGQFGAVDIIANALIETTRRDAV